MPSKVKAKINKAAAAARPPKCHVRTGDRVVVLSGKTRGKTGTVIRVWPREQRALVEGDAAVYDTRHVRGDPQQQKEGGRIKRIRPLHVSKLALLDPTTGKATRVRHERQADGAVVRVAVKSKHRFVVSKP